MFIELQTPKEEIRKLLTKIGFFTSNNEFISKVSIPGVGNMNVVLRIETNLRSFIIKQSRDFVQKHKSIDAPIERIAVENQFYTTIKDNTLLKAYIPKVLGYNSQNHLLILEDLGNCEDMTRLYESKKIEVEQLTLLIHIAANIHNSTETRDYPKNKSLRLLNHQHIFELPFMENNGFSLDAIQPGLENISIPYKKDIPLKDKIKEIGALYLSEGTTLIHGDYYPGSWISKKEHIHIIDPEFSFLGFPEFDLGVLAAHTILIAQNKTVLLTIEKEYPNKINAQLLAQISGIEIMRRLIGLAQLPISLSIKEKEKLLLLAYNLIM